MCPHCGKQLAEPLKNGVIFCSNCHRMVETKLYQKLLSAAHYIRKNNCFDIERIKFDHDFSEEELIVLNAFVVENDYNHQEFSIALKNLGIDRIED